MFQMPAWLVQLFSYLMILVPFILFAVVCLFAINWNKMWPTLAEGGWVPLTLVLILIALVWAQIKPAPLNLFGLFTMGNFWWQLGAVGLLTGLSLFCGWVQRRYSWTPMEVSVEPPAHDHHHDHGHHHH